MITETLPRRLLPMLATSTAPFDDEDCLFERKEDGVRAMAAVEEGSWRLWGREGQDFTVIYPELAVLRELPSGTIVDGELVLLRDGRADFHALMARHRQRPKPLRAPLEPVRYVVFDLPYCAGRSLLREPLVERRAMLGKLMRRKLLQNSVLTCCEGVIGAGKDYFAEVVAAGHEGVVAKRLTGSYTPGKRGWRKIKQSMQLPCVVVGYNTGAEGIRSLHLATLRDGTLSYIGGVELGVPSGRDTLRRLEALGRAKPVIPCPQRAQWVQPTLFCVVGFHGWRPGESWRDPHFIGWVDN